MLPVERLIVRMRGLRRWHVAAAVLRLLLGFAFVPAGLKKVLGQPFTDPGKHGAFHDFLHAFHATGGFYRFVGVVQLVIAVLLLTQRGAAAGAALAVPVLTAIGALCWSTAAYPTATVVTLMWLGALGLVAWELPRLRGGQPPTAHLIDLRTWAWCGIAILTAYAALCVITGDVYRPRKVAPSDPAFYVMPLIALMPVVTYLIERAKRGKV